MQYGKFSKDASEFVVTRFDTPRPWLNCIFNDVYGLFLSQIGQGYSFYRNVMAVKVNYIDIFGYVPTHPQTGKFIYLRDEPSGRAWPAFPMHPNTRYRNYRCAHGQGYSEISASWDKLSTTLTIFVPPGSDPVEIWRVTIRNEGAVSRKISAFAYQEWQLTAPTGITDTLTYTRASWRADLKAIVARMTNPTSPLMYDAFMSCDQPVDGTDCSVDSFLGPYGKLESPAAVVAGACTNSSASGERMCGAMSKRFEIPPGGEVTFHIASGVSFGDADVRKLTGRYLPEGKPAAALAATKAYWANVRDQMTCSTPQTAINILANSWMKYQTHLTARFCRGGTRGYRDVIQDAMGFAPLGPARTRETLLTSLRYQYSNGLCLRGYDHIGKRHDMRLHRDSPIWIPGTLSAYVRETGDLDILDEKVPFYDSGEASVFDHLLAALNGLYKDRNEKGLCLIGDGDWNDSLDEISRKGKGVSVWLTIAAVHGMQVLAEVARSAGRADAADKLLAQAAELSACVNEHGWDGRWYVYAFTDDGVPVGSDQSAEGKIHLNAQTWAVFTGIAQGERLKSVLDVIDNTLDTKHGPVLIHPNYTSYVPGIGKVSGKNPGMAENGPIYTHATMFKLLGDFSQSRGDKAYESLMKVLACAPGRDQEYFQGEPFAAFRYLIGPGCAERFGQSPYSHFTGSPAWGLQMIYERMLGVRPEVGGLRMDPCIPAAWKGFEVVRPFRGATYRIHVSNPKHVQRGVRSVTADSKKLESNLVPIFDDGEEHDVVVKMG